jgi:hypothetical protein
MSWVTLPYYLKQLQTLQMEVLDIDIYKLEEDSSNGPDGDF